MCSWSFKRSSYADYSAASGKAKVTIDKPGQAPQEQGDDEDELSERMQKIKVESLVHEYLGAQKLQVIAENGMTLAVDAFVDKEEKEAIKQSVNVAIAILSKNACR